MNKSGHIAGILFSIIFGFSFMFSKILLESITPMGVIAYRFLVAFIVFEVLRLTKVVKIRFKKKLFVPIILVAFFQPILYFIFETYGLNIINSSEAGMMIALIPIFVVILSSLILNEKPNRTQIVFIVLSVLGILLIQIFKSGLAFNSNLFGVALLFFAVLSAALFNIASRKASTKVNPYELTYFMMLYGAVVFNIIYVAQLIFAGDLTVYYKTFSDSSIIFPLIYLGVIASIGGFFLVNYALSKLPAHVSSIYSNLSTVVAVFAGYMFLDESIRWYHIVGGLMIVIGVYGTARTNYRSQVSKTK